MRFEHDSTTRRTRCLRFEYDTTSYEEPTRSYAHSSNNEHVNSFALLYGVVANQRVGGGASAIVTYNLSVYSSARFRRFVSIYTVFIMNDPIKNLSGQDIGNLIELFTETALLESVTETKPQTTLQPVGWSVVCGTAQILTI